jgi:hypothetical protein
MEAAQLEVTRCDFKFSSGGLRDTEVLKEGVPLHVA